MGFFLSLLKLKPDLVKILWLNNQNIGFILSLFVCISYFIPLPPFNSERIFKKQIYCPFSSKINFSCNKIQCLSMFLFFGFHFQDSFWQGVMHFYVWQPWKLPNLSAVSCQRLKLWEKISVKLWYWATYADPFLSLSIF